MAIDAYLLRTNETSLKGGNRASFEQQIVRDVVRRLKTISAFRVRREQGSVVVLHQGPLSAAKNTLCLATLVHVFGVARVVPVVTVSKNMEAIAVAAAELLAAEAPTTFKVYASRSDKSFRLNSHQIASEIGGRLLAAVPGVTVDVHDPTTPVTVDISPAAARVSVERVGGAGGLPHGVSGKVVAMLSGGIDSPVAAWKMMRRGCSPTFVHFHSYPYVGREAVEKVKRLAALLAEYGDGAKLHLVPIGDAQREITAKAGESFRVLLYRRLMLRIAERIGRSVGALGIVTGESVGQVASQTLENMAAVAAVTTLPLYRPLVGDDKEDIVGVARRIGTYATSIEPHDDCCTLFVPRYPSTRATAAQLDAEESKYDFEAMIATSMRDKEVIAVQPSPALAVAQSVA